MVTSVLVGVCEGEREGDGERQGEGGAQAILPEIYLGNVS